MNYPISITLRSQFVTKLQTVVRIKNTLEIIYNIIHYLKQVKL